MRNFANGKWSGAMPGYLFEFFRVRYCPCKDQSKYWKLLTQTTAIPAYFLSWLTHFPIFYHHLLWTKVSFFPHLWKKDIKPKQSRNVSAKWSSEHMTKRRFFISFYIKSYKVKEECQKILKSCRNNFLVPWFWKQIAKICWITNTVIQYFYVRNILIYRHTKFWSIFLS